MPKAKSFRYHRVSKFRMTVGAEIKMSVGRVQAAGQTSSAGLSTLPYSLCGFWALPFFAPDLDLPSPEIDPPQNAFLS